MRELGTLYESFTAGKPSPLNELSIQHADFIAWQRQYLQGGVLEDQLSYWKKQLAGAPAVLKLPIDHPRSQVQAFEGARRSVLLPQNLYEGLKDLSSQERVTLFMTLLAAFKSLLFCCTGQQDIVVGTPIAGRDRLEIEGVIGLFINTLVLRTDFSVNPTFREVLGRVRNVALGAYSHQDMPFAKLVEQLQPKRQLGTYPLFNVWFVFRDRTPTLKLSDMTVSEVQLDVETARYDLKLEISKRQDGLSASFVYDKGLFNASTIVQIADHFVMLVRAVVNRPDLRLRDITDILAEADRQQQVTRGKEFSEVSRQKLQQARRKATAAPQFKARD